MDSVTDEDAALPLDFDASASMTHLRDLTGHGDVFLDSSAEFSEGQLLEGFGKPDRMSPGARTRTMKDYETQIAELKKENFGLKLRIYFLEERMQQTFEDTPEDVFKTNIELKVELEKLKRELVEKQELLVKASNAVEALAGHNEAQMKQLREEHDEELREMREAYENKFKEMEKEVGSSRQEVEESNERIAEVDIINQQLNDKIEELQVIAQNGAFYHKQSEELQVKLSERDEALKSLQEELDKLDGIKEGLEKSKEQFQMKVGQMEVRLGESENQNKQLKENHERNQNTIQELKERIKKFERSTKDLREELHEKELQQIRNTRSSEDTDAAIERFQDALNNKTRELEERDAQVNELEEALGQSTEAVEQANKKYYQIFDEHSKVLHDRDSTIADLKARLQSAEQLLERMKQTLGSKDVEIQRLNNGKLMIEQEYESTLKQKELELKELADKLQSTGEILSEKTDVFEHQYQELEAEAQRQLDLKDKMIERLASSLQGKDKLIEELVISQARMDGSIEEIENSKNSFIKKLQEQLKQNQQSLHDSLAQKNADIAEKQQEVEELHQSISGRDRVIDRMNNTLKGNEERVKYLEKISNEKDHTLQQLKNALENQQKQNKDHSDTASLHFREKETVITKLNNALNFRDQEIKALKNLLGRNQVKTAKTHQDNNLIKDINQRLLEKEKLMQEMVEERSKLVNSHETENQKLYNVLNEKDYSIKEATDSISRLQAEKNGVIERLQQMVLTKDQELNSLERSKMWMSQENELMIEKLKVSLQDKDRTIESLIDSGKEKDKMFLKLQEVASKNARSPSPKKQPDVSVLHRTIEALKMELDSKNNTLSKLEEELRNSDQTKDLELQNIENTMKIETLQHELEAKNQLMEQAHLALDSLGAQQKNMPHLEDLQKRLDEQTQASLKRTNLELDAELKAQKNSLDAMSQAGQIKDNIIKNLQDQLQLDGQSEDQLSQVRTELLAEKKATALAKQRLAETHNLNQLLQTELEQTRKKIEAYTKTISERSEDGSEEERQRDRNMDRPSTPQRETIKPVGRAADEQAQIQQLQEMLQAQIQETVRLNSLLDQERGVYRGLQSLGMSPQGPSSSDLTDRELEAILVLRTQLENGIQENEKLRHQLLQQMISRGGSPVKDRSKSPSNHTPEEIALMKEIHMLKSQLEDSERWNSSLQARLEELQPRARGVGSSDSNVQLDVSSNIDETDQEALTRLKKENEHITDQLKAQMQQTASLKQKLDITQTTCSDLEKNLMDANEKLDYYGNNLYNGDLSGLLKDREAEVDELKKQLQESKMITNSLQEQLTAAAQHLTVEDLKSSSPRKVKGMEDVQKLRERYESGIRENEEFRQHLERQMREFPQGSSHQQNLQEVTNLSRELNTAYRKNEELRAQLQQSNQMQEAFGKQLSDMTQALSEMDGTEEINALRRELSDSQRLSQKMSEQMKDVRRSTDDVVKLQQELRETKRINEQLGGQLQQVLQQASNIGREAERLKKQVDNKEKLIAILQAEQNNQTSYQTRSTSPLKQTHSHASPQTQSYGYTQTSPGMGLKSPPPVQRLVSPYHTPVKNGPIDGRNVSTQVSPMELATQNASLKSDLKTLQHKFLESEKYRSHLQQELDMYVHLYNENGKHQRKPGTTSHDLLATYMNEMRELRLRLEESIRNNDALRSQLERRIADASNGDAIDLPDKMQLIREVDGLRAQVEAKQQVVEKLKRMVDNLNKESVKDKEQIKVLHVQILDCNKVADSLRQEISVYDHMQKLNNSENKSPQQKKAGHYGSQGPQSPNNNSLEEDGTILLLLNEIRSLRKQLERSIDTNEALRLKLEEQINGRKSPRQLRPTALDISPMKPVRKLDFSSVSTQAISPLSPRSPTKESIVLSPRLISAEDMSKLLSEGRGTVHVLGKLEDFELLRQCVLEACKLAKRARESLRKTEATWENKENKLKEAEMNITATERKLSETSDVLDKLWTDLLSGDDSEQTDKQVTSENQKLRGEVIDLRKKVSSQERLLQQAIDRVEASNSIKKQLEGTLMSQLTKTFDTLSKSRNNLQTHIESTQNVSS